MSGAKNIVRIVIADANVLLSAFCGMAASKGINHPGLEVYTTAFTMTEVYEYLPVLAAKYRLTMEQVEVAIESATIHIKPLSFYQRKMEESSALIIDPDDVELGALALTLGAPVWSNDNHFKDFPTGRYTTAELLKSLGI
jgi:predicted nucleic acid-binding protein